jgi:hypothetical protein
MKVYLPVLEKEKSNKGLHTKLDQFQERTITFMDNMKAGAKVFLDECHQLLNRRHPGMSHQLLQKPSMSEGAPEDMIRRAVRSHAVITGFGD